MGEDLQTSSCDARVHHLHLRDPRKRRPPDRAHSRAGRARRSFPHARRSAVAAEARRARGQQSACQCCATRAPSVNRAASFTQHPRPAFFDREPAACRGRWAIACADTSVRYTEWRDWKTGEVVARELYDHRTEARAEECRGRSGAGRRAGESVSSCVCGFRERCSPAMCVPGRRGALQHGDSSY